MNEPMAKGKRAKFWTGHRILVYSFFALALVYMFSGMQSGFIAND